MTYTRTYPQTNQQSYQYNYQTVRPVTRYVTPQYQQHMLVQNNMRPGTQTVAPAQVMTSQPQVMTSQPRYPFQNHVLSTSRAVTTERLSHFDYGEQDEVSNNRPGFPRTSSYQQVIENEDKSTLRVSHAGHVPSYNPVFVGPQPAQIIGQLRPNQTFVSQPNIISTQSSTQFRVASVQQPYVVRNQIRNSAPLQQGLPNRAPNVVATPAQSSSTDYSAVRPVILTAQQAGQTFQSSPVVVQINGGKSIRGSIVSLNTQQQQQQQQQPGGWAQVALQHGALSARSERPALYCPLCLGSRGLGAASRAAGSISLDRVWRSRKGRPISSNTKPTADWLRPGMRYWRTCRPCLCVCQCISMSLVSRAVVACARWVSAAFSHQYFRISI